MTTLLSFGNRSQTYLKNAEEREEGGTPDILGSLRAGMAMQIKNRIGEKAIAAAESEVVTRLYNGLQVWFVSFGLY